MRRVLTIAALAVIGVSGCSAVAPAPAPTPTPTVDPSGDGVLRIGTLFELTGDGKQRGAAEAAGVELAVREINQLGGVNGALVEVHHRDGSDAADAFAALLEKNVDVVIGPDSGASADVLIPLSAEAGVPLVSASAPTGDGVMSFSLVAAGSAADGLVAQLEGSLLYVGADGADLAAAAATAGLDDLGAVAITAGQTDFTALVTGAAAADAIVIDTSKELTTETAAAITALLAGGVAPDTLWFTGDALRAWPDLALEGANGYRSGVVVDAATEKLLRQSDPGLHTTSSAAEAHDAVVLAALAATLAGDDGGPSIASRLRAASEQGIHCSSFGECIAVLADGQEIDYRGFTDASLGDGGAPVTPASTLYRYTAENSPERVLE